MAKPRKRAAPKHAKRWAPNDDDTTEDLRRALAALDAGNDVDAIGALVDVWRARRSPAIAELVDLLDARQPERAFADVIAKRPDVATKRLATTDTGDPRLSAVLIDLAQNPRFLTDQAFWTTVMVKLAEAADPRLPLAADAIRDTLMARLSPVRMRNGTVAKLNDMLHHVKPPREPTAEEAALETQIASRLGGAKAKHDDEARILREIYDDPTADGPRLVYADLLAERGDPRGELIALQFARRDHGLDESQKARERWLLKQHMKEWLGGLAPAVSNTQSYSATTFERGFVALADIYLSAEKQLPLTWSEPGWATVEELRGPFKHVVLEKAPLRGLRRITEGVNVDGMAVFARMPEKFRHLEELEVFHPDELGETARDALRRCTLPSLRSLTVLFGQQLQIDDVLWLVSEAALASPLRRVVIAATPNPDQNTKAAFDRVVDALMATSGRLPEVGIVPPWRSWPRPKPFELVRGANGFYQLPPD